MKNMVYSSESLETWKTIKAANFWRSLVNKDFYRKFILTQNNQWSSTETVNSDSIPDRVKPKTIEIGIHSFFAYRWAMKGTVWSLHRVW